MSIFIYHTNDSFNKKPYDKIFLKYGPVYYGVHNKNNFFFDGSYLNYGAALPSNIKTGGIIEYAETYGKNSEEIYKKIRKDFYEKYCYFLTRFNGPYLGGVFDYLYYFRIHVRAATRFLDENNIKFMFLGPPSGGFDNIMVQVADKMGIDYIGLLQNHNKKFFWVKRFDDIGTFSTSLPIFNNQNIKVKGKIYKPFYVPVTTEAVSKKKFFKLKIKIFIELLKDMTRPFYYSIRLFTMLLQHNLNLKINSPVNWLYIGNKSRGLSQKYIQKTSSILRKSLENDILPEKSKSIKILFYLKIQPEATEALSNILYNDQLLIIDKLQNISPLGTKIYIKEHPTDEYNDPMARANFWNSISKKKNIFVLPSKKKTENQLEHFDIVATLDGAIGWEAIRNLKPVIVFGKPWYLSMPGIFDGHKIKSLDNILEKKWTLEDISKCFSSLTKKMGDGIVIHLTKKGGYIEASDEFTNFQPLTEQEKKIYMSNNDKVVAESFYKIFSNTYKLY